MVQLKSYRLAELAPAWDDEPPASPLNQWFGGLDVSLMDLWDLIREGRYCDAVKASTAELRRSRSGPSYCNRGVAYLNLADSSRALAGFRAASDTKARPGDCYLQSVGVAQSAVKLTDLVAFTAGGSSAGSTRSSRSVARR